jgi:hypothetical protein
VDRGFFAEVRVWMLELLGKEQPITQHTRAVAWFLALWGEMWQRPSSGVVAGIAECVRLFAESGDEDAPRWPSPPGRRPGCSCRARCGDGRAKLPTRSSASERRQHVGRGDHRGLARAPGLAAG